MNIYEKNVKEYVDINKGLKKLEGIVSIENSIATEMNISKFESERNFLLKNARDNLRTASFMEDESAKAQLLASTRKQIDRVAGEMLQWPAPTRHLEIVAMSLVSLLSNKTYRERITSAKDSGFVTGESHFYNMSVRNAFLTQGIRPQDKDAFIAAVNRNIERVNEQAEEGNKIRKLNRNWF